MKWTTANVKHPNYLAKHEIFVGTHTGSFKHLIPAADKNPYAQSNLSDISSLDKTSRITALAFGNDERTEILLGRAQNTAELHTLKRSGTEKRTVEFTPTAGAAGSIVGLARYNDRIIAGIDNGQLQSVGIDDEKDNNILLTTGDHMDHLRQCAAARHLVATGGKSRQNNLKVYDLSADGKQVFNSKNLPHDYLQLEVPVWDSDIGFIDGQSILASCSRHGYVRVYDTRQQRRPVSYFASEEHGMSFAALVGNGNYIYTGTTMGALKAFDTRRMKTHIHTYKGFTGGISDLHLDATGKYLCSSSLDRYVRIHDTDSTVLLYQCYVKSKATKVLIRQLNEEQPTPTCELDQEEEISADVRQTSKLKKGNKSMTPLDAEYEDMFEQMPTVGDSDEEETEVTKTKAKSSKRKGLKNPLSSKRKKQ